MKPGSGKRSRKRTETQADAAALLGISPQRLQDMRRNAPWWRDDLKTDSGWDVVGIAVLQTEFHVRQRATSSPADDLKERKDLAEVLAAEEQLEIKRLERRKREREEAEAARQIVQVDTVATLLRESLGELRLQLDDLPFVFAGQVPPEFREFVFVEESQAGQLSDLAPLQRLVMKVTENFQRWLDRVPEECFMDADDPDE